MPQQVGEAVVTNENTANHVPDLPPHEAGQFIGVCVTKQQDGTTAFTINTGDGWVEEVVHNASTQVRQSFIWKKAASSNERLTVDHSTDSEFKSIAVVWEGQDPTSPIDASASVATNTVGSLQLSGVTTGQKWDAVLYFPFVDGNDRAVNFQCDVNMEITSQEGQQTHAYGWTIEKDSGATTYRPTVFCEHDGGWMGGITIALKDADPTGTPTTPPFLDPTSPFAEIIDPLEDDDNDGGLFAGTNYTGSQIMTKIAERPDSETAVVVTFDAADISSGTVEGETGRILLTKTDHGLSHRFRGTVALGTGTTLPTGLSAGDYSLLVEDKDTLGFAPIADAQDPIAYTDSGTGTGFTLTENGYYAYDSLSHRETAASGLLGASSTLTHRTAHSGSSRQVWWTAIGKELHTASQNLDGELVCIHTKWTTRILANGLDKSVNDAVMMGFIDGADEWQTHIIRAADDGTDLLVFEACVMDIGYASNYIKQSDPAFDPDDIDGIVFFHKINPKTTGNFDCLLQHFSILKTIRVLGGHAGNPITYNKIAKMVEKYGYRTAFSQGDTQAFFMQPVQIGDGTTGNTDTYADCIANSVEFPADFDKTTGKLAFQADVDKVGVTVDVNANSTVKIRNCVHYSPKSYTITVAAGSSASATYDFQGAQFLGANITFGNTSLEYHGITVDNAAPIDADGLDLDNFTGSNPRSGSPILTLTTGGTDSNTWNLSTETASDHLVDIDSSSGAIVWNPSNKTFTGATDPIEANGTNDQTYNVGDNVTGLSSAADVEDNLVGGTLTVSSDKTRTYNNAVNGSKYHTIKTSDGTTVTSGTVAGGTFSVTVPSGTEVIVCVQDSGYYTFLETVTISANESFDLNTVLEVYPSSDAGTAVVYTSDFTLSIDSQSGAGTYKIEALDLITGTNITDAGGSSGGVEGESLVASIRKYLFDNNIVNAGPGYWRDLDGFTNFEWLTTTAAAEADQTGGSAFIRHPTDTKLIRGMGFRLVDSRGAAEKHAYLNAVHTGTLAVASHQMRYNLNDLGWTNFNYTGSVDEPIMIYEWNGGVPTDNRSGGILWDCDIWGYTVLYQTVTDSLDTLQYQINGSTLVDSDLAGVAITDIDANSDGTADVSPYSLMGVTDHTGSPATLDVDNKGADDTYNYEGTLSSGTATKAQRYHFDRWYRLHHVTNADAYPPFWTINGEQFTSINAFGITYTNVDTNDRNGNLRYTDLGGDINSFATYVDVTVSFSGALPTDTGTRVIVFETANYNSASATIVQDPDSTDMNQLNPGSSHTFQYDWDTNGDLAVTIVACGDEDAQWGYVTGTITSAGLTVGVSADAESSNTGYSGAAIASYNYANGSPANRIVLSLTSFDIADLYTEWKDNWRASNGANMQYRPMFASLNKGAGANFGGGKSISDYIFLQTQAGYDYKFRPPEADYNGEFDGNLYLQDSAVSWWEDATGAYTSTFIGNRSADSLSQSATVSGGATAGQVADAVHDKITSGSPVGSIGAGIHNLQGLDDIDGATLKAAISLILAAAAGDVVINDDQTEASIKAHGTPSTERIAATLNADGDRSVTSTVGAS